MKRYSIRGWMYGADKEAEICQVDSHPEDVIDALKEITLMVKKDGANRRSRIEKYSSVRFVENVNA